MTRHLLHLATAVALLTVVLAGCADTDEPALDALPPLHPDVDVLDRTEVTIRSDAGEVVVQARVAAAPAEQQRGLMHVPDLPDGVGMLFTFDADRDGGFWMKDTLVPLDIAFIDRDGRIVAILAMDPCEADPCPVYTPEERYRSALEVPQGWFADQGVAVGDDVTWTEPVPEPA